MGPSRQDTEWLPSYSFESDLPAPFSAQSRDPVCREELFERVWTTPISHLAAEYGVSGSYLEHVYTSLGVPRPPVGYWQKKAVGKSKPRPPLPEAQQGDQVTWSSEVPLAKPVAQSERATRLRSAKVAVENEAIHPLLRSSEELFRKTRRNYDHEFLRPYKLLLADIVASEACLPKALQYANALYSELGRKGHRVMLSPTDVQMRRALIEERETPGKDKQYGRYSHGKIWSPYRPTITFIGKVPIGLTITEMTERITLRDLKGRYFREDSDAVRSAKRHQLANSWTHEKDVPSGRCRVVAYSPRPGVDRQTSWQESSKRALLALIPEIIRKLSDASTDLAHKENEAREAAARRQHEFELQQERRRREEDRRQVAAAKEAAQKQLSQIIQQWSAAETIVPMDPRPPCINIRPGPLDGGNPP